jgi:hypothetical protein
MISKLIPHKKEISMLLSLARLGMKIFTFIVGSGSKTRTTLYKTEAVTLETVKLLEALERYDLLVSDIKSRAYHRHFMWSNGSSPSPQSFSLLSVPFHGLVARTEILPQDS